MGRSALPTARKQDVLCLFHPAMPDDPLVFVEVALTAGIPRAIAPLIGKTDEPAKESDLDTVVFYSISNCHLGLAGVSFGNFLIKQVVEEVGKRHPRAKRYVTLSPVPGFCSWLALQEEALGIDIHELRCLAKVEGADTTDLGDGNPPSRCAPNTW